MRNTSIRSKRARSGGSAESVASATTGTITSVAGSASSITILAANTARRGAFVYNDSAAILYLALSDVTASTSVFTDLVLPFERFSMLAGQDAGYTGIIKGIWASATGNARVTELT